MTRPAGAPRAAGCRRRAGRRRREWRRRAGGPQCAASRWASRRTAASSRKRTSTRSGPLPRSIQTSTGPLTRTSVTSGVRSSGSSGPAPASSERSAADQGQHGGVTEDDALVAQARPATRAGVGSAVVGDQPGPDPLDQASPTGCAVMPRSAARPSPSSSRSQACGQRPRARPGGPPGRPPRPGPAPRPHPRQRQPHRAATSSAVSPAGAGPRRHQPHVAGGRRDRRGHPAGRRCGPHLARHHQVGHRGARQDLRGGGIQAGAPGRRRRGRTRADRHRRPPARPRAGTSSTSPRSQDSSETPWTAGQGLLEGPRRDPARGGRQVRPAQTAGTSSAPRTRSSPPPSGSASTSRVASPARAPAPARTAARVLAPGPAAPPDDGADARVTARARDGVGEPYDQPGLVGRQLGDPAPRRADGAPPDPRVVGGRSHRTTSGRRGGAAAASCSARSRPTTTSGACSHDPCRRRRWRRPPPRHPRRPRAAAGRRGGRGRR